MILDDAARQRIWQAIWKRIEEEGMPPEGYDPEAKERGHYERDMGRPAVDWRAYEDRAEQARKEMMQANVRADKEKRRRQHYQRACFCLAQAVAEMAEAIDKDAWGEDA